MPNHADAITSLRWTAICPWLILVRAARVSLMLRVILLALAGVLITQLGWSLVDRVVLDDSGLFPPLERLTDPPDRLPPGTTLNFWSGANLTIESQTAGGPLARAWTWTIQPFRLLISAESWRAWFALLLDGAWTIAVWALFGGAIARIAALYLTHGETMGPVAALKFAVVRWPSTAGAPAFALFALYILALPLIFVGFLMRLDIFALLLGLFWFLPLVVGLGIAVLAIGVAFGWPMMVSTVAVERTDAFDGISRAYAYVYQRPLHALFYVLVAGLLGILAQAAVTLVVDMTLMAMQSNVSLGAGPLRAADLLNRIKPAPDDSLGWLGDSGSRAIQIWTHGFACLRSTFPMAYLWPAATGIYLLLRRQIDAADLGDVTFDEGDPQRGLPTLVNDPVTGVPQVVGVPTPNDPSPSPPPLVP